MHPRSLLGSLRALSTRKVHERGCPNKAGQAFLRSLWCIIPICHPFLFGPNTHVALWICCAGSGSASLGGRDTPHPRGLSELPVFRKCQGETIRVRGPRAHLALQPGVSPPAIAAVGHRVAARVRCGGCGSALSELWTEPGWTLQPLVELGMDVPRRPWWKLSVMPGLFLPALQVQGRGTLSPLVNNANNTL